MHDFLFVLNAPDVFVFVCFYREDLNQLRMFRDTMCAEIKDDEKTIALTEEKCTLINKRFPEMIELEKTEKDRVTHTVYI